VKKDATSLEIDT